MDDENREISEVNFRAYVRADLRLRRTPTEENRLEACRAHRRAGIFQSESAEITLAIAKMQPGICICLDDDDVVSLLLAEPRIRCILDRYLLEGEDRSPLPWRQKKEGIYV